MSSREPDVVRVQVGDAEIGALHWPGRAGSRSVVAVHGITANAWSWAPVARHLDGAVDLVAVDLRGRGSSSDAPPPYGMRRHADDVAALIERLGMAPAVVLGHSMGTWVALMCAERHPALVADLVLVDGGVALPLPEGADPDAILAATLGPALERLRVVWPDRASYRAMWAAHPALGGAMTPEVEQYVLSDLVETQDGLRSCVSEEAVRHDGRELLVDDEVRHALDRHAEPVRIVRAETGLLAVPPPMVPLEAVDRYPQHRWVTVEGANHYDVLVGDTGAAVVASLVREAVDAHA